MNAVLLVFNLVPAFPLDGGRIARAAIWKLTGDRNRATRISGYVGQGFAVLLMGFGLFLAFTGNPYDGIWLAVLGYLLWSSARAAVLQTAVTSRLDGVTVADIMDADPVTIPADLPVQRAYEEFFLRYQGWPWFAVVEADGRYAGLAHRAAVESAALGHAEMPVRELAADSGEVRDDAPLEALLGSEPLRRLGALMAVDADGRLRGVVTLEQVSRALQSRLAPRAASRRNGNGGASSRRGLSEPARRELHATRGIASKWSLDRQAAIPAAAARSRISSSTIAEQSRIGSPGRRSSSIAAASKPSTAGIRASSTTTSGSSASTAATASCGARGLAGVRHLGRGVVEDRAHQEADVGVVVDDEHPDRALAGALGHVRPPI